MKEKLDNTNKDLKVNFSTIVHIEPTNSKKPFCLFLFFKQMLILQSLLSIKNIS